MKTLHWCFFAALALMTNASDGKDVLSPLKDGEYIFQHKYAEAQQHRIKSIRVLVKIKGNHIIVINNDRSDVFPMGVLEEGTLMWHFTSSQWIIGNEPSDKDTDEVGGCSDGPTVVDLEERIYWTC